MCAILNQSVYLDIHVQLLIHTRRKQMSKVLITHLAFAFVITKVDFYLT